MRFIAFLISSLLLMASQPLYAGVLLVANKGDHTVTLLDEPTLKELGTLPVGKNPHEVAVNPAGDLAAVTNYGSLHGLFHRGSTLTIIDIDHIAVLRTIQLPPNSRPHGVQFISNREVLVTVEGIQSFLHIDVLSGEILRSVKLPGKGAHLFTVDKSLHYAYIACTGSGEVIKLDLEAFSVIATQKIGRAAEGIALDHNDEKLFVTNRKDHTVTFMQSDDLSITKRIHTQLGPIRLQLFSQGQLAAITNSVSGTVQTFEVQTGSVVKSFRPVRTFSCKNSKLAGGLLGALSVPITIVPRADGETAYVANSFAGNITLVNLLTGEILRTFETGAEPDGLALTTN